MKFRKTVCAVAAVILFLTLVPRTTQAIGQPDQSMSQPPKIQKDGGRKVKGFILFLRADKNEYAIGEPILLEGMLQNVGESTAQESSDSYGQTYKLSVTRPDGTAAPLTAWAEKAEKNIARRGDIHGGDMSPGDKISFSLPGVTAWFDMTQAGEYQLRVSRTAATLKDASKPRVLFPFISIEDKDDYERVTITSNVVTLTVLSAEETKARETAKRRATTQKLQSWQSAGNQEVEGLSLSLKSEKRRYALNTPIGLFMTLENIGREDDAFFAIPPTYKLEVLRADGDVAPFTGEGSRTQGVVMPLLIAKQRVAGPGDTKTSQHDPNYYFDMAQPGEYYVRASLAVPRRDDAKKSATVFSNVVRIRIEAPPAN
jgi:hypothetical protein